MMNEILIKNYAKKIVRFVALGKRKGSLEETLSYCTHKQDPKLFYVTYRDKDAIRTVSLFDFMTKEQFADIPLTRILQIKGEQVVWEKGQKQVKVKV